VRFNEIGPKSEHYRMGITARGVNVLTVSYVDYAAALVGRCTFTPDLCGVLV